jgi:hypothetical protein
MPITFDTLEELKAFYRSFRMEDSTGSARSLKAESKPVSQKQKKTHPKPKAITQAKVEAAKVGKAKKSGAKPETLTARIQATVQDFIQRKRPFTTNDLYEAVASREKGINRASAITAISKMMNTQYASIKYTEKSGKGPRPIKVYKP